MCAEVNAEEGMRVGLGVQKKLSGPAAGAEHLAGHAV